MKRRNLTLGVTVLVFGLAVLAGSVWAQSIEIPVSGTESVTTIDPGRQFTDADGITHYRGLVQVAQIVGQDADGVPVTCSAVYVDNINIDMVTGNGDISVKMSTEMTYGDLSGTWEGSADLTITGFVFYGPFNYSRGGGDFNKWHMRGSVTGIFAGPMNSWDAYFHIPSGDKAATTESRTWSGVKDLYRWATEYRRIPRQTGASPDGAPLARPTINPPGQPSAAAQQIGDRPATLPRQPSV